MLVELLVIFCSALSGGVSVWMLLAWDEARRRRRDTQLRRELAAALERNTALAEDIAVLQYEVARLHEALERSQQRVLNMAAMDGANDPLPTRRYIPPGGAS